jgi:hypothetical protein
MAIITNYVHQHTIDDKIRKFAITGQIKKKVQSKLDRTEGVVAEPIKPQTAEYGTEQDYFESYVKAFLYCMKTMKHLGANQADRVFIWATDKDVINAINNRLLQIPNEKYLDEFWNLKEELSVRFGWQDQRKPNRFVAFAMELTGETHEVDSRYDPVSKTIKEAEDPLAIVQSIRNKRKDN